MYSQIDHINAGLIIRVIVSLILQPCFVGLRDSHPVDQRFDFSTDSLQTVAVRSAGIVNAFFLHFIKTIKEEDED